MGIATFSPAIALEAGNKNYFKIILKDYHSDFGA